MRTGSTLDEFLDEEDVLAETEAVAVKRVIANQLKEMMKQQGISKTALAERMKTSRAARALGMRSKIELAAA